MYCTWLVRGNKGITFLLSFQSNMAILKLKLSREGPLVGKHRHNP